MRHIKTTSLLIVFFSFLFSTFIIGQDLTGIWQDNNGTRYSFRQLGSELYWRMDGRPTVINVFYGTISGKNIIGEWVDLPGAQKMGDGSLAMEVVTNDLLRKVGQGGNYGATEWRRISVFTQPIDIPINEPPIVNLPTVEPHSSDWKEVFSFGAPKEPAKKVTPFDETMMMDEEMFDPKDEDEPKAKLWITDLELLDHSNPRLRECGKPGYIMVNIQNIGNKAVADNNPTGMRGEMTLIRLSRDKGKYEPFTTDLSRGRIHNGNSWVKSKPGLAPQESIKVLVTNSLGHRLSNFWVRVKLIKPVWDEESNTEKIKVVQTVVKEFNQLGFDLSIPKGSLYIHAKQNDKASLLIMVKNEGQLPTPGSVKVTVRVPLKNKKNLMDHWVEFKHDFHKVLQPGEMISTASSNLQALIHFNKGEPDWDNMHVKAWSGCKEGGSEAFDIDKTNNDFYGKSRITTVNPNY